MSFAIDTSAYKPLSFSLDEHTLSAEKLAQLKTNIELYRDTIVFFTAVAGARGVGGHSGGPYDIVPEVLISEGFMNAGLAYPVCFDEAGHRVAIQYALAAFGGAITFDRLLRYRCANDGLYGHPELDTDLGIKFSSGRLGHVWPFINGIALAHPGLPVVMFGSDGSQQEGDDAEAARLAVAKKLNVKLMIDDNDVTIAGHPSEYLPGYDVTATLKGHGITVDVGEGEDVPALYRRIVAAFNSAGPIALVNKRPMAPGIPDIEATAKGHDVIPVDAAIAYLEQRGQTAAVAFLKDVPKESSSATYRGSSKELGSNRTEFGTIVSEILDAMSPDEKKKNVVVIDSDLEGSTGLATIRKRHPDVYVSAGIMERGNFSAAAGFGFEKGKQGVFSTFSAFLEMVISELTMARLNDANVLCHFSHAGIDDIADNTCHYGINLFFADNGPEEISKHTRLYFPADTHQFRAVVSGVFSDPGARFVFSTRSKVPYILNEDGRPYFGEGYTFVPGKDDVIRTGSAGYVIAYGEMLYRALDAVERLRADGIDVGLINKTTLNVPDDDALAKVGATGLALVVETQNRQTGLGVRYGTWLLERGYSPQYGHLGTTRRGAGGLGEHIMHQGLGPDDIVAAVKKLAK